MVPKKIICNSLTDLNTAAKKLLDFCENDRVFAFYGKMGAGKTTFIQAICKQLGVEDIAVSPSFSIVNVYKTRIQHPVTIYHLDFFRIKNINEVYDIGYEDYLYSNTYCFIEWPEKIETLLPPNYVKVIIEENDADKNGRRYITIQRN